MNARSVIVMAPLGLVLLLASAPVAAAQDALTFDTQALRAVGWRGFLDFVYILESFASLVLATALGALIAFHPMTSRTVDTLEEIELPKVYIMYALIGAVVGVTVLKYGLVVGFVVFGLGGLMRFRTNTTSTRDTGRLILVTLIGLICGLNLPHFAVLAALFAFVLIYFFDANPTCRVVIEDLAEKRVGPAAEAYAAALAALGCKILSRKMSLARGRVELVFRSRAHSLQQLRVALPAQVPENLRGEMDWKVE